MRALALCLLVLVAARAHATPNMVQICTNPAFADQPAQACIETLKWDVPKATDLILTRPGGSSGEWGAPDVLWKVASSVLAPMQYRSCSDDLPQPSPHGYPAGQTPIPDPCVNHVWVTPPNGQNVLITCDAPTKNTDGTAISGTQLPLGFYFWEGQAPGPVYRQVSPKQSGCSFNWPNLEVGPHYFAAIAVDALGAQSSSSNEANKTVLPPGQPAPLPPTNLTGTVPASFPLAWTIATVPNSLAAIAIGTANPGATCDKTQSFTLASVAGGATQYRVNVADVQLYDPASKPLVAFTTCP